MEGWVQMKKALLIFLLTISPAFADDQNVYDFFRQLPNSDSAIVDEQTTDLIKRHMANLLYPVDMSSLARPETDAKFREQVIALQKQMGVPTTGTLTLDEFGRLAEAARDIDDRSVGTGIIKKLLLRTESSAPRRESGAPTISPTDVLQPSTLVGLTVSELPAHASSILRRLIRKTRTSISTFRGTTTSQLGIPLTSLPRTKCLVPPHR